MTWKKYSSNGLTILFIKISHCNRKVCMVSQQILFNLFTNFPEQTNKYGSSLDQNISFTQLCVTDAVHLSVAILLQSFSIDCSWCCADLPYSVCIGSLVSLIVLVHQWFCKFQEPHIPLNTSFKSAIPLCNIMSLRKFGKNSRLSGDRFLTDRRDFSPIQTCSGLH